MKRVAGGFLRFKDGSGVLVTVSRDDNKYVYKELLSS